MPRLAKEVVDAIADRHMKLFVRLNDFHILTSFVETAAIEASESAILKTKNFEFPVPGGNSKYAETRRTPLAYSTLLASFARRDQYANTLIVCVSLFEEYLAQILRLVLLKYPKKLSLSPKGTVSETGGNVPVNLITDSETIDDVLSAIVDERILAVMHAKPAEYLTYFEKVTGLSLPLEQSKEFFEIKASRDVIVHNGGVANDVYVAKTVSKSRSASGENLDFDNAYLFDSIRTFKEIANSIREQLEEPRKKP